MAEEQEHSSNRETQTENRSQSGEAQGGQREGASLGGDGGGAKGAGAGEPEGRPGLEVQSTSDGPKSAGATGVEEKQSERAQTDSQDAEPQPVGDGKLAETAASVAGGVVDDVKAGAQAIGDTVKETVGKVVDGAAAGAKAAEDKVDQVVGDAKEAVGDAQQKVTETDQKASATYENYDALKGVLLQAVEPNPNSPTSQATHEAKELVQTVGDLYTVIQGDDPKAIEAATNRAEQKVHEFAKDFYLVAPEVVGKYIEARNEGQDERSAALTAADYGTQFMPFAGAEAHFEKAATAYEKGDNDTAVKEFTAGLQSFGTDAVKIGAVAAGAAGGGGSAATAAEGAAASGATAGAAEGAAVRGAAAGEAGAAASAGDAGGAARATGAAGEGEGAARAAGAPVDPLAKTVPAEGTPAAPDTTPGLGRPEPAGPVSEAPPTEPDLGKTLPAQGTPAPPDTTPGLGGPEPAGPVSEAPPTEPDLGKTLP